MMLNYLFLPLFFFIGLITSYEDFRYGKIRNKWIILGFVWALAAYSFFFTWNLFHFGGLSGEIPISFLWDSLLNGFAALGVAYLIWRLEGWSAGDAKLFFVFSLLIPASFYQKSYLPIFPSFALLVNIFIPLLLFLFVKSCFVFFTARKLKGCRFKILKGFFWNKIYWFTRGALVLGFLGLILFFDFLREAVGKHFLISNMFFWQMLFFAALMIFSRFSGVFFKKKAAVKIFFLIFALSFGWGVFSAPRLTFEILVRSAPWMIIFMFVLGLFIKLLDLYVSGAEKRGGGAFSMAIWIFLGGILTLILKGSVLSLALGHIFS